MQWWRIPSCQTAAQLKAGTKVLRRAGSGERGDEVRKSPFNTMVFHLSMTSYFKIIIRLIGVQRGMKEEQIQLAVEVVASKACSEEGLEDVTALLLNLSYGGAQTRESILLLLLAGARH